MAQAELVAVALLRGLGALRLRALGASAAEQAVRTACGLPGHTSFDACSACSGRYTGLAAALGYHLLHDLFGGAAPAWLRDAFALSPMTSEGRAVSAGWRAALGTAADLATAPLLLRSPLAALSGGLTADQAFLPLRPLALEHDAFFPVAALDPATARLAYVELDEALRADLRRTLAMSGGLTAAAAGTIQALLLRYTWSVPAAPEHPASLYDVGALGAAIAACLPERDGADDPSLTLLGADISGLQSFLYTITSAGAARSLRGRSLYLTCSPTRSPAGGCAGWTCPASARCTWAAVAATCWRRTCRRRISMPFAASLVPCC